MKTQFNWTLAVVLGAVMGLTACSTTVSKGVNDEGKADEVIFPDAQKNTWLKEGTFVNLDNLRTVRSGVSKDQLYDLLGRPHFAEGMYGVREWDYLFNFRTGQGNEFVSCQYKVLFDKNGLGQTFHWKPVACADRLNVVSPAPVVVERIVEKMVAAPLPTPVPVQNKVVQLHADGLFAFGKSGLNDLLVPGRQQLDKLAAELRATAGVQRVVVTGHTDRLGSAALNDALSMARAVTVRDYLVSRLGGMPAPMTVDGRGPREPVVQCAQTQRDALVACLAPNRRVEIEVQAKQAS